MARAILVAYCTVLGELKGCATDGETSWYMLR